MSAVTELMRRREAGADQLAEYLGLPIEDVYAELVAAEAEGLVRVEVVHPPKGMPLRTWKATGALTVGARYAR